MTVNSYGLGRYQGRRVNISWFGKNSRRGASNVDDVSVAFVCPTSQATVSMTLRLSKLSQFLALFTCFMSALPAQGEGPGGKIGEIEASRRKLAEKRKKADEMDDSGEVANMTPEQLLEARKRSGSRGQCRFVAAMRPPKLLPGQQGSLLVTAILQGRSVLEAPTPVVMTPRSVAQLVEVGAMTTRPPALGTIHKGYLGRPVYENTAVFEVPVTLSQSAKLGEKVSVALEFEFDVYDGDSAQVAGRFTERVNATVEVAPHLDPPVQPRQTGDEAGEEEGAEPAQPSTPPASVSAPASSGPPVIRGGRTLPGEPADDPQIVDEAEEPPSPVAGGDALAVSYAPLIGGGIILLAVLLLLLRKR